MWYSRDSLYRSSKDADESFVSTTSSGGFLRRNLRPPDHARDHHRGYNHGGGPRSEQQRVGAGPGSRGEHLPSPNIFRGKQQFAGSVGTRGTGAGLGPRGRILSRGWAGGGRKDDSSSEEGSLERLVRESDPLFKRPRNKR